MIDQTTHGKICCLIPPTMDAARAAAEVDIMVDDVIAAVARIAAQGGTIVEPPQRLSPGETYAVLRDPDGNRLGFDHHDAGSHS